MHCTLLSWLLSIQLILSAPSPAASAQTRCAPLPQVKQTRLWWGMIDPGLACWFARIPQEEADSPVLWDFSWRGFLAALFGQHTAKEDACHVLQP